MKIRVRAFITVEYTMLIVVIFLVYSFLLNIGIFLYNECILQTNVKILALEAAKETEWAENHTGFMMNKKAALYPEKYLFIEEPQITLQIAGEKVLAKGKGVTTNTLSGWGIGAAEWSLQTECELSVMRPVDMLRLCKRLRNLEEMILPEEKEE